MVPRKGTRRSCLVDTSALISTRQLMVGSGAARRTTTSSRPCEDAAHMVRPKLWLKLSGHASSSHPEVASRARNDWQEEDSGRAPRSGRPPRQRRARSRRARPRQKRSRATTAVIRTLELGLLPPRPGRGGAWRALPVRATGPGRAAPAFRIKELRAGGCACRGPDAGARPNSEASRPVSMALGRTAPGRDRWDASFVIFNYFGFVAFSQCFCVGFASCLDEIRDLGCRRRPGLQRKKPSGLGLPDETQEAAE